MGFTPVKKQNVIIRDDHIGDKNAEATGLMAARIAGAIKAAGKAQEDKTDAMAATIAGVLKSLKFPAPCSYVATVIDRDENNMVKTIRFEPESVK